MPGTERTEEGSSEEEASSSAFDEPLRPEGQGQGDRKPQGLWGRARGALSGLPTSLICVPLLLTAAGFVIGVWIEDWEPVCTAYVIAQVVTTVGYGDITVRTAWMKEFMALYVLLCLVFFAYAVNVGAQNLAELQCKMFTQFLRRMEETHLPHLEDCLVEKLQREDDILQQLPHNREADKLETEREKALVEVQLETFHKAVVMTAMFLLFVLFGTFFYGMYEACSCSYGITRVAGCVEDTLEECRRTGGYTNDLTEALYMSIITLTTVGFGDHTPRTKLGRVLGVFWMVFGVTCTVMWLESLTKLFFELESARHFDHSPVIDEKIFKKMDGSDKGYLTMADFRSYMLVHHKLVAEDLIDEIDAHFARLTHGDMNGRITLDELRGLRVKHKERMKASASNSRSLQTLLHHTSSTGIRRRSTS